MKQLTQNLKNGKMELLEVPYPALNKGYILVQNHYSVISAGTEGKTVKDARLGYIGKAMERQKEVKQVIDSVKNNGIAETYKMVMNKLDAPSALGYSSVGEVIEVGKDVTEFKVGDYAACGGSGAVHSEIISVPKNLAVKISNEIDLKYAAFTTIGAIALQGVRQAALQIGESCAVIGLGLIGQLTMQILSASGVKAIGIDLNADQVKKTLNINPPFLALERNRTDLEIVISSATNGFGVDAVIITAGSNSLDPVDLAGEICRKKGKVIIVGSVPTGFSRKNYYQKELELKMSSSYGPGRYDKDYEEKGIDYPYGYVRWTEKRNMEAFAELLKNKKIDLAKIVTHEFKFEDAEKAYDLIIQKNESFTGIILKYNTDEKPVKTYNNLKSESRKPESEIRVGFIGAGSFAQNYLLPNLKDKAALIGVTTSRGNTARNIVDKYNFKYAAGSSDEIINDENINTIFIASRHNLHAENIIKGLKAGKNVFTEKPLCITESELEEIKNIYHSHAELVSASKDRTPGHSELTPGHSELDSESNDHTKGHSELVSESKDRTPGHSELVSESANGKILMIGFNRRFSPHIIELKKLLPVDQPKAINYRINAGILPADHWIHDKEIGGGRIIGELCHFIDLSSFIAGSLITSVSASLMNSPGNMMDTLSINLEFKNGSIASISYFSNGNKNLSKEYLEVFYAGKVIVIDDFIEMKIIDKKEKKIKLKKQDKGHKEEINQFINAVKEGRNSPISFEEIYNTTLASFKIIESIKNRSVVEVI